MKIYLITYTIWVSVVSYGHVVLISLFFLFNYRNEVQLHYKLFLRFSLNKLHQMTFPESASYAISFYKSFCLSLFDMIQEAWLNMQCSKTIIKFHKFYGSSWNFIINYCSTNMISVGRVWAKFGAFLNYVS